MDTAAFYFAVSAISRRFHRPRMIDRNNYTRDTIHAPNNGIAVVCHGEKRKKKKKKKKIPTHYKTNTRVLDPFPFRGVGRWRRIFFFWTARFDTQVMMNPLVSFERYPVSPSLNSPLRPIVKPAISAVAFLQIERYGPFTIQEISCIMEPRPRPYTTRLRAVSRLVHPRCNFSSRGLPARVKYDRFTTSLFSKLFSFSASC